MLSSRAVFTLNVGKSGKVERVGCTLNVGDSAHVGRVGCIRTSTFHFRLQDNHISAELTKNVILHYDYVWHRTQGLNPKKLFEGVPSSLWGDVTVTLYGDILCKVRHAPSDEILICEQ